MNDRLDDAMRDFYARTDLTDEQKATLPIYAEMHDKAVAWPAAPATDELAAAGVAEIAMLLTRFGDQIEDEWRDNLIKLGAGFLKQMWAHQKD